MTPFGIRKRLGRLLGLGAAAPTKMPARREVPRFDVRFELPDGSSYEARGKSGDPLARISGRGPQPLATGCGDTSCGTCAVEILEGEDQLTPESEHERITRKANQVPDGRRLACATSILGEGVAVRVFSLLGDELA